MSNHTFYPLHVAAVTSETSDTTTISFDVPSELKDTFQYQSGQYLTLKFILNGEEARRAYSMSSSPSEDTLAVTVKRVEGGLVSNHINDNLQVGEMVEVLPPDGRFCPKIVESHQKTYYLFGAGSGITPLMSILKTLIEEEPKSEVYLFYGNRHEESIIFKTALDQLQQRYEGQLTVVHTLSQPKREKGKGLSSFFSKGKVNWTGKTGRLSAKLVKELLQEYPARNKAIECFICGPGEMIDTVKRSLDRHNVPAKNIHIEYFSTAIAEEDKIQGASNGKVTVHLDGQTLQIEVPSDKSILDALLNEGYDPPYSCTSGACSTCLAKTIKGKVKMDVHYAIDDSEVEEGYILTCQSHPMSKDVEITFEV